MNTDQINAYNELSQLLMDNLGYTSTEASNKINELMEAALEALNSGVLENV